MSINFISNLPPNAKLWVAKAIAGLIIADGVVSDQELAILRESISFLENMDQVNEIVNMVKSKQKPILEVLKTERKLSCSILMSLAMVALTDDKLSGYETEYFSYIAGKLGFESSYAHLVIKWGKDYIRLNQQKKKLLQYGEKLPPIYINY